MVGSIFDGRDEVYKQIGKDNCLNLEKKIVEKKSEVVGRLLIDFRLKRSYTQQEISDTIGIARQTYAGYEAGRHEPSIEILTRIADIYGVSLDLITGRYTSTAHSFIQDAVLNEEIERSQDDTIDEQIELSEHRQKKKYNRAKK